MFNSTFSIPAVLVSESLPLQYTLISLTAAIFLVLLILLYHVSANRRQMAEIQEKLSDNLDQTVLLNTKSPAVYSGEAVHLNELDDRELLAVLTAAVAAYEEDMQSIDNLSEKTSAANTGVMALEPVAKLLPIWDAPTTAGFRVRAIKRVS